MGRVVEWWEGGEEGIGRGGQVYEEMGRSSKGAQGLRSEGKCVKWERKGCEVVGRELKRWDGLRSGGKRAVRPQSGGRGAGSDPKGTGGLRRGGKGAASQLKGC